MKYCCSPCNYATTNWSNFNKHIKTKKHLLNTDDNSDSDINNNNTKNTIVDKKYTCSYCEKEFKFASSLSKHKKSRCKIKGTKITDNDKIEQLEELKAQMNYLAETNKQLIEYIKNNQNSKTVNKTIINNNISIRNYVQQNYLNAPPLQPLKDYTIIENDPELLEDEDLKFIDILIEKYNSNQLPQYLGDYVIKFYKKNDPKQQSLWNTDTSRLTYIVKQLFNNKNSDWIVDKKGIKTASCIVEPMLGHIKPILEKFKNDNLNPNLFVLSSYLENEIRSKNIKTVVLIVRDIDNKSLTNSIIKYIAPYFYLTIKDSSNTINNSLLEGYSDED